MDNNQLIKVVAEVIRRMQAEDAPYVTAGISSRHIHLSTEDFAALFGAGATLTHKADLKQPGEFASGETLTVSGRKGSFENVRVLGPLRKNTQVELSISDRLKLGVDAPVCESGKLDNAGMITLTNPVTGVSIERKAAIAALRHIHATPDFAQKYGLQDRDMVSVAFAGARAVVFGQVLMRVSDNFRLEIHLDTDEANAGGVTNGTVGKILL